MVLVEGSSIFKRLLLTECFVGGAEGQPTCRRNQKIMPDVSH
jgi:hypothetical protein